MSAELYSGTIAEFTTVKRRRQRRGFTWEGCDCLRVRDVRDRGGEIVADTQLITICSRLRELEIGPGDTIQFMGTLKPGRGFFFAYKKLPPR